MPKSAGGAKKGKSKRSTKDHGPSALDEAVQELQTTREQLYGERTAGAQAQREANRIRRAWEVEKLVYLGDAEAAMHEVESLREEIALERQQRAMAESNVIALREEALVLSTENRKLSSRCTELAIAAAAYERKLVETKSRAEEEVLMAQRALEGAFDAVVHETVDAASRERDRSATLRRVRELEQKIHELNAHNSAIANSQASVISRCEAAVASQRRATREMELALQQRDMMQRQLSQLAIAFKALEQADAEAATSEHKTDAVQSRLPFQGARRSESPTSPHAATPPSAARRGADDAQASAGASVASSSPTGRLRSIARAVQAANRLKSGRSASIRSLASVDSFRSLAPLARSVIRSPGSTGRAASPSRTSPTKSDSPRSTGSDQQGPAALESLPRTVADDGAQEAVFAYRDDECVKHAVQERDGQPPVLAVARGVVKARAEPGRPSTARAWPSGGNTHTGASASRVKARSRSVSANLILEDGMPGFHKAMEQSSDEIRAQPERGRNGSALSGSEVLHARRRERSASPDPAVAAAAEGTGLSRVMAGMGSVEGQRARTAQSTQEGPDTDGGGGGSVGRGVQEGRWHVSRMKRPQSAAPRSIAPKAAAVAAPQRVPSGRPKLVTIKSEAAVMQSAMAAVPLQDKQSFARQHERSPLHTGSGLLPALTTTEAVPLATSGSSKVARPSSATVRGARARNRAREAGRPSSARRAAPRDSRAGALVVETGDGAALELRSPAGALAASEALLLGQRPRRRRGEGNGATGGGGRPAGAHTSSHAKSVPLIASHDATVLPQATLEPGRGDRRNMVLPSFASSGLSGHRAAQAAHDPAYGESLGLADSAMPSASSSGTSRESALGSTSPRDMVMTGNSLAAAAAAAVPSRTAQPHTARTAAGKPRGSQHGAGRPLSASAAGRKAASQRQQAWARPGADPASLAAVGQHGEMQLYVALTHPAGAQSRARRPFSASGARARPIVAGGGSSHHRASLPRPQSATTRGSGVLVTVRDARSRMGRSPGEVARLPQTKSHDKLSTAAFTATALRAEATPHSMN
jgi:hypothetical protein